MSRLRASGAAAVARVAVARVAAGTLAAVLVAAALAGCPLISFERLSVTVWPKDANAILPLGASPWITFPAAPDKASVQRLFTLSNPSGSVNGDFRWEGARMYFDAVPTLSPGVRYVMRFRGRVTLEDGQSFDADEQVPFYVAHAGGGPVLQSVVPSDGATAGTTTPLVLRFSGPVDPNSFAREFGLQPSAETTVSWDATQSLVTITPRTPWTTLATYTWTVSKDLAAPDGTPAGIDYTGRFRVQLDSTAPTVVGVQPGVRSTFTPTGNPLSQTGADDVLLITFSEEVTDDSLESAFTITPGTKGALLRVTSGPPAVFAFIPDGRWVMGQSNTLCIGTAVTDLSGNKLSLPFEATFTPAIPIQTVRSIQALNAPPPDSWTVFNTLDAKPITIDIDGSVTLVITFTEPFTVDAEVCLPLRSRVRRILPFFAGGPVPGVGHLVDRREDSDADLHRPDTEHDNEQLLQADAAQWGRGVRQRLWLLP